jgi:CBS domain containing-hemolysin-like protein
MVPADSVKAFDFRKTLHENIHDLGPELHRSYPVSRDGSLENVDGYIRVRDLLARDLLSKGGGEGDWHPLIRPLIEIDGNASLSSLLTRFLESGEIAALVKKDGSNSGWITLDDVTGTLLGTRG